MRRPRRPPIPAIPPGQVRARRAVLPTQATTTETRKKLGNIEDYEIFRSDLFMGGEFNMMLVVKFKNTADMASNKAKYQAFMKEHGAVPLP